jgi:hypothetical protein
MMASLGGVLGGVENVSPACSTTTESMESGSMLKAMVWLADEREGTLELQKSG